MLFRSVSQSRYAARYADEQKQQEIRAAVDSLKIDFDQIEKIENITKNAEQITDVDISALMDAIDFNTVHTWKNHKQNSGTLRSRYTQYHRTETTQYIHGKTRNKNNYSRRESDVRKGNDMPIPESIPPV